MQLPWKHGAASASIIFVPDEDVLISLMGKGWGEKTNERGFERMKATVILESLKIRYHFARQCLLVTFSYRRFKFDWIRKEWTPLDLSPQDVLDRKEVTLQVYLEAHHHIGEVKVNVNDTLADVRVAIITQLVGTGAVPERFNFYSESENFKLAKIQSRFEQKYPVKKFLLDQDDGKIVIDKQDPAPLNFDDLLNTL